MQPMVIPTAIHDITMFAHKNFYVFIFFNDIQIMYISNLLQQDGCKLFVIKFVMCK